MLFMSKQVKVLFFAILKESSGVREEIMELHDGASIHDLRIVMVNKYPDLRTEILNSLVAMNGEYAEGWEMVSDNAEVAFFPRVSGGDDSTSQTICKIQNSDLAIDDILSAITQPTTGAVCSFSGIVRAITRRGDAYQTEYLEYDAYVSMAEAKMFQIAQEIRERWTAIDGIAIIQRIGVVRAGELSVVIACAAAHRDTGVFEAVHYGIDRLKEIVPVWKCERGPDRHMWIEGNYTPKPGE
jgi:molybdopterin synthase catalytic subunit/molybdopterin converting factor small subunit